MSATSSELRWTSHLLREDPPWRPAALIGLIGGFSAGAGISLGPLYGWISAVVLTAAMSRYLLPVRYHLTDREVVVVHAGMTRRAPWERFRRFSVHPDGVFLSPFDRPSRLDAFRGCFLRFRDNREEVLELVRGRIQTPEV
jgi:hypothetical protein